LQRPGSFAKPRGAGQAFTRGWRDQFDAARAAMETVLGMRGLLGG
jgi:hypothetical protein